MMIKKQGACYRPVKFILITLVVFFVTSCDLFKDDDADGVVLWRTLSSYEEIGTLTVEDIGDIYPSEVGAFLVYDITAYRLVYNTETPTGGNIQASGVVLVPQRNNPAAMLSLHRSTIFHNSEVPSNVNLNSHDNVNTVWTNLGPVPASAGFITVMPDLLGWGASSNLPPPFLVSYSEGIVSLDMLKATVEFLEAEEMVWNDDLYVTGYSRGGSTTLSLIRSIQADPHNRFQVTAASAGGGAYNLEELAATILGQNEMSFPHYYVFFIKAYRDVYFPTRPLSSFFNSPYDLRIESEQLFNGSHFGHEIAERLSNQTDVLFLNTFRNQYITGVDGLREALNENDLSRFRVQSPLRIYHGDQDEIIPFAETQAAIQNLINAGSENIELIRVEGGTHISTAAAYFEDTFLWFLSQ